ncbi:helix-turn-helix domain-containing protein [Pedobacter montanisoli]|uniref:Helix-turn-helix domain-containing protein n=1 Tax=Pedobacter montanisoli TaxID=2923277 RepID=A0ABS9ZZA2_9SPHI|nr:helix-turn-helix transcriptional regulator [Pedobacter montanisoli]MCJ0743628.1 helix-turn-helix domain-containing protein [Pedobacter montanisoli]
MDLEKFKIELGKKIAHTRKKNGLTQPELGALLGKDFQSISRIENGKVNISAHFLYEIAKALNVSVETLLDFKN